MDKDEILRKAQNGNKPDERERQIQLTGSSVALIVGLIVCVGIMIVKIVAGVPYMDVYGVCVTMAGVQNLYHGIRLGRKNTIILGILGLLLGFMCLVAYIVDING